MPRCTLLAAVFLAALACPIPLPAQTAKPDRAKELEAEIGKLEGQLAKLRAELGRLRLADRPLIGLLRVDLEIGMVGPIGMGKGTRGYFMGHLRVDRILSDKEMVVTSPGMADYRVILRGLPTKEYADGKVFPPEGVFEVKESKRVGASTYFVLEKVADKIPKPAIEERRPGRPEEIVKRLEAKKPPEPNHLSIAAAWERAAELADQDAVLTGVALVKPDTRNRLLLTFRDPTKATRVLCRVRVEKAALGPLAGLDVPAEGVAREVTVEATVGGTAGGELILNDPKVVKVAAKP